MYQRDINAPIYFVLQTEAQIISVVRDGNERFFETHPRALGLYHKISALNPSCIIEYHKGKLTVVEAYGMEHAKNYYDGCINAINELNGNILDLKSGENDNPSKTKHETTYFVLQTTRQIIKVKGKGGTKYFPTYSTAKEVFQARSSLFPCCIVEYYDKKFTVVDEYGLSFATNYYRGVFNAIKELDGIVVNLRANK